jgi:hypothetical protein
LGYPSRIFSDKVIPASGFACAYFTKGRMGLVKVANGHSKGI